MLIKMLTSIAGTPTAKRGEVLDLPEVEAMRFIQAGIASLCQAETNVETAAAPQAPERAQMRRSGKR